MRRDQDDPYLVVAADKGTATFSDIANAVSAEYGFWLGDAFASGGSAGYDHKEMAITARGAWESVKRHFREIGTDIQREDFTVVGVGDMSGDVFGNGMLLSQHIRLVAAFNHLHIFIDPDPDPEASLCRAQAALRSAALGLVRLRPQVDLARRRRLRRARRNRSSCPPRCGGASASTKDSLTPAELIRAMLQAEVDLLWLGGIGTYVKACDESHAEVGDRANDALRVEASRPALQGGGGGRQSRLHPARPRSNAALSGRPHQHRRRRQFRRRRLLRPRGQHQDPAERAGGAPAT